MAKHLKAYTIALSLVMPAAKISVKRIIGEQVEAKSERVSFSSNTVKRRIQETSVDIAEQVIAGVRTSKFRLAIQLDESTYKCQPLLSTTFLRLLYTE